MKNILPLLLLIFLTSCHNTPEQKEVETKTETTQKTTVPTTSFFGNDFFIDDQHSYIGFKIKYFGFSPVRGRFNQFNGTAFYNEDDITQFSASIFIDVNSINTGNERRDNDLKSEDTWFNAPAFPTAIFHSTDVIPKEDGAFDLLGEVTIKGVTKDITFHFDKPTAMSKDWAGNDQVDFSGKALINRQDFGVFGGDFWSSVMENGLTQLSDEVELELDMHCRKANYQIRYESSDSTDISKIVLDLIKTQGLNKGLQSMDEYFKAEKLTSGKLYTIGHTLNAWEMYDEAIAVFNKRLVYYPEKHSSYTQLGITNLFMGDYEKSVDYFKKTMAIDSTDSRAFEYLRLLDKIK